MKPPWEWTEADLLGLISVPVQESITLDYKACGALQKTDPKKDEVSKDVSAFANSAGGTVVYGVVEANHLPERIDVGFDPQDVPREWLEQVINSRIQRRIDDVIINPVDLVTTNPGRVAYVVYVPQSERAPHQAADKKFYKRFNSQSVPMEEYEVRDVARRTSRPRVELTAADTRFGFGDSGRLAEAKVQFRAYNDSTALATFVVITLGVWEQTSVVFLTNSEWELITVSDNDWKVARLVIASGSSRTWSPLTPGFTLAAPEFTLRTPNREKDVFGPRAVAVVRLDHDGGTALYRLVYRQSANPGERLRLMPGLEGLSADLPSRLELPAAWFRVSPR